MVDSAQLVEKVSYIAFVLNLLTLTIIFEGNSEKNNRDILRRSFGSN